MTDCTNYRVISREYGGGFDVVYAPPKKEPVVLLVTENVSVQTLVEVARKHMESKVKKK